MIEVSELRRDWANIDKSDDPEFFTHFLGSANKLESVRQYKQKTFDRLHVRSGNKILDVGCGTGDDLLYLARLTGKTGAVVGVDASETMIDRASERLREM